MAQSDMGGSFPGGIKVTCILKEGDITVTENTFGIDGYKETTAALASRLQNNDVVAISADTANTYSACGGLPVVCAVSNGSDLVCGKIVSEPRWVSMPAESQDTWSTMLTNKYYRIATVEMWCCNKILEGVIVTADAVAVTPGGTTLLDFDVSAITARTYDVPVVNDIAGGAGSSFVFSFHYQAKTTAGTVNSVMLGILGLGTAAT